MRVITVVCVVLLLIIASFPVIAQQEEMKPGSKMMSAEKMPEMMPPKPLSGEFNNWIVGEWEGYSTSPMGKSKDVMKCEAVLDGQFLLITYEGKMIEHNEEMMKEMGEKMQMSDEAMEKMKEMSYKGMGLVTQNPQTGGMMGYWFDNWRGISKGSGSQEKGEQMMTWKGPMGTEIRTIKMTGRDNMVVTFKSSGPMGEFEGKSEYTRKSSM
ncbi:MAG: hypothetical protein ACE5GL_01600 [Calditrichia bacterium]